jgi:putative Mg2+ transporter-C (MgtC) family protein
MDVLRDASTADAHAQLVLAFQVLVACVAGGIVGLERELAGKRAGVRTHMLVAVASCLAVGVGLVVTDGNPSADPTRVMHGLLTGVGFIGAGAILNNVKGASAGLTTAATVLLVAVLGATTAFGAPLLAVGGATLAVLLLRGLHWLERGLGALSMRHGPAQSVDDLDDLG